MGRRKCSASFSFSCATKSHASSTSVSIVAVRRLLQRRANSVNRHGALYSCISRVPMMSSSRRFTPLVGVFDTSEVRLNTDKEEDDEDDDEDDDNVCGGSNNG